MITDLEKATAQAIVNIFETGKAQGDYGKVTLVAGDRGQLTYGRSQTTLASGNLYLLLKSYCDMDGGLAAAMAPYLTDLAGCAVTLNTDMTFRGLLKEAGDDPLMQSCQDLFFDRVYWIPAAANAAELGLDQPLSLAVVYDSEVHGSWPRIRDRTNQAAGAAKGQEKAWIAKYVELRRAWLSNGAGLLPKTVYRMDTFGSLIAADAWKLPLPLAVRGIRLDESSFGPPPVRVSAHDDEVRLLRQADPNLRGADVSRLQAALSDAGFACTVDGVFGPGTAKAVAQYQTSQGVVADGIVGPSTRARLGL